METPCLQIYFISAFWLAPTRHTTVPTSITFACHTGSQEHVFASVSSSTSHLESGQQTSTEDSSLYNFVAMEQFEAAAEKIKVVDASKTSNDDKLKLYGLFKQVNNGDCTTTKPGMLDLSGKAKWEAWKALEGKSKEDAMKEYVVEVDRQLAGIA